MLHIGQAIIFWQNMSLLKALYAQEHFHDVKFSLNMTIIWTQSIILTFSHIVLWKLYIFLSF